MGPHHPRVAETLRNLAVMKYEMVIVHISQLDLAFLIHCSLLSSSYYLLSLIIIKHSNLSTNIQNDVTTEQLSCCCLAVCI